MSGSSIDSSNRSTEKKKGNRRAARRTTSIGSGASVGSSAGGATGNVLGGGIQIPTFESNAAGERKREREREKEEMEMEMEMETPIVHTIHYNAKFYETSMCRLKQQAMSPERPKDPFEGHTRFPEKMRSSPRY